MPLAIASRSDGMQVAGEAYGPVVSCSALSLSTFCSAQAIALSTAVLTVSKTSETMVVAVGLASAVPSVLIELLSDADIGDADETFVVCWSW